MMKNLSLYVVRYFGHDCLLVGSFLLVGAGMIALVLAPIIEM